MYGETGQMLRTELTALLHQHRVRHYLQQAEQAEQSTASRETSETSAGVERASGLLLQYRLSVLTWCIQACTAAQPLAFSNQPPAKSNPFHPNPGAGGVVHPLLKLLRDNREQQDTNLPTLAELTTPHTVPLVEHWRAAAKAAALAEHDIGGTDTHGILTTPQAQALVGDVAAITQALVVLDRRYHLLPGWQPLAHPQRLGWATLAAALDTGLGQPDYTIDKLGWQPLVRSMRGAAKPGVLGVLQAEHNLLHALKGLPTARDLRLIVDSQRRVTTTLAVLAAPVDQRLHDAFTRRAQSYADLHRALRDIGGLLGHGKAAVAQAATLATRTTKLTGNEIVEPRQLAAFHNLFTRVDNRIADIVEHAIAGGTYLQRTTLPELADTGAPVLRLRERYTPSPNQPKSRPSPSSATGSGPSTQCHEQPPTKTPADRPSTPRSVTEPVRSHRRHSISRARSEAHSDYV
ncbi:hypothetical protein [Nocardioides sambongensis]|uniref:hypothetical protein n=1 Tax=Nocardioides sambongensis TaxID=2589074 RepID=UPI001129B3B9|nr:hypothetical protein [Nocardioides sambongensis]